jgi:GDP-D-mannose dehydratase
MSMEKIKSGQTWTSELRGEVTVFHKNDAAPFHPRSPFAFAKPDGR